MKQVSNDYKNAIIDLGRQYDVKITYGNTTLTNEQLNEVTPHYRSDLLKSVMKQLDLDSNVEIPIGTEINCQFGLKVGNNYEYIDYGNYIVYSSEKQEDLLSYRIVCYDKMLYAMKDYEDLELTYPISIKDYISAIATKIGLEFDDEDFTNADKEIPEEKYLDENGNTLGYTYRDVLDELAQVTASIIKVEDNKLKITYPQDVIKETSIFENTSGQITTDSKKVLDLEVEGNTTQDGTPTPDSPIPVNVVTGDNEINICGKNLFEPQKVVSDSNNAEVYITSDNQYIRFKTGGTRLFYYPIGIRENTQYTFSFTIKNGANSNDIGFQVFYTDGTNETLFSATYTANQEKTQIKTTASGKTISYIRSIYTITQEAFIKINGTQLEKGNQATTYEPYIGNTYPIYLGAKNLWNWTPSTITLVKSTSRYINIYPTSSITLKAGTYNLCLPDLELNNNNYDLYVQMVGVENAGLALNNKNRTFTISEEKTLTRLYVFLSSSDSDSATATFSQIQITKGSDPQKVSDNPIELCKINDYKDRIFKGVGSNLFKGYNNMETGFLPTSGSYPTTNSSYPNARYQLIELKAGESITTSNSTYSKGRFRYIDKETNQVVGTITNTTNAYFSSTGTYDDGFASGTITAVKDFIVGVMLIQMPDADTQFMINYGTTALPYEPYNAKDKWYIEKKIGKVVLDGSETTGWNNDGGGAPYKYNITDMKKPTDNNETNILCNYYTAVPYSANWNNYDYLITRPTYSATNTGVKFKNKDINSLNDFKTWLSTHNTIVYYVLETPIYYEITNTTLINELESIELIDGLNNISITSANLSSPLKISYISEYETITEDYLKDVNVNFSEKFGPVNSLVLSRSADSDLIYRKDDSSIEKNGLTEIKISDNQILNGNDRDEYIDNIFNRLKGIEYYINNYDSTGITYLDLGDFYKVEARGNRYLALMLNDELNVTQGFEELIHTDKPDTSVSDYKKADTTDRRINQATLIVDKQNQTIQALTSRTSNLESKQINDKAELLAKFGDYALDSRVDDITTQVETLQTDTYTKTEVKSILKGTFYDSDNNQIVSEVVKTTSGTFDENGMHYEKTNAKTKSTINEVGVRVDNAINDSELLFAGYDDNINQTIVRTDNLTVRNFLVVGSQSRFQDYEENNEQGTGVFDL